VENWKLSLVAMAHVNDILNIHILPKSLLLGDHETNEGHNTSNYTIKNEDS